MTILLPLATAGLGAGVFGSLLVGTLVSIGLLAIGGALMALAGRSPLAGSRPAPGTAVLALIASP